LRGLRQSFPGPDERFRRRLEFILQLLFSNFGQQRAEGGAGPGSKRD